MKKLAILFSVILPLSGFGQGDVGGGGPDERFYLMMARNIVIELAKGTFAKNLSLTTKEMNQLREIVTDNDLIITVPKINGETGEEQKPFVLKTERISPYQVREKNRGYCKEEGEELVCPTLVEPEECSVMDYVNEICMRVAAVNFWNTEGAPRIMFYLPDFNGKTPDEQSWYMLHELLGLIGRDLVGSSEDMKYSLKFLEELKQTEQVSYALRKPQPLSSSESLAGNWDVQLWSVLKPEGGHVEISELYPKLDRLRENELVPYYNAGLLNRDKGNVQISYEADGKMKLNAQFYIVKPSEFPLSTSGQNVEVDLEKVDDQAVPYFSGMSFTMIKHPDQVPLIRDRGTPTPEWLSDLVLQKSFTHFYTQVSIFPQLGILTVDRYLCSGLDQSTCQKFVLYPRHNRAGVPAVSSLVYNLKRS